MKILLLSYGIIDYDGRLIELYDIANKLGDVTLVCCGNMQKSTDTSIVLKVGKHKYLGIYLYMSFVIKSLISAIRIKNIDILIVDNYFAALVALIIKRICNVKFIVQDVRELYFIEDMRSWRGRMLFRSEVKLMTMADIVLAANNYRSEIMFEHYKLNRKPLVFENIRFLMGNYDKAKLDIKYKSMFKNKFNIISTGGISVKRGTDKLVKAMKELSNDYSLYLVGGGSEEDIKVVKDLISHYNLKNVHIISKVPLPELRYIVQQCDIGIVNYHKEDLNNKYCASGKVYEYLAEGLPIVTTENIPLKEFCEKNGVGESDDDFYNGILKVSTNIRDYKEKVRSFIREISVDNYNSMIANQIVALKNKEKEKNE